MSTGYLVLELGDPLVSRDGCCPEDLNNSRSFGSAEGIAAPVLDLSKDPAKHDLAGVVVPAVGSLWCFGGHNGGFSFGVVGLGIIAQNTSSDWAGIQLGPRYSHKPRMFIKKRGLMAP